MSNKDGHTRKRLITNENLVKFHDVTVSTGTGSVREYIGLGLTCHKIIHYTKIRNTTQYEGVDLSRRLFLAITQT